MSNLICSNIYKLWKSRAFYVCLILLILMGIGLPFLFKMVEIQMQNIPEEQLQVIQQMSSGGGFHVGLSTNPIFENAQEVNVIWFIEQLFTGNVLVTILAIFISIFLVKEFSYGTIKNTISKGFSRTKVYLANMITLAIALLIMILVFLIPGIITTACVYGFGNITNEIVLHGLEFIALQILMHFSMVSVFMMFVFAIRKTAGIVIVNILLLSMGEVVINLINFLIGDKIQLLQYWLPSVINEVNHINISSTLGFRAMIVSLCYLVISTGIGMYLFKKGDIK